MQDRPGGARPAGAGVTDDGAQIGGEKNVFKTAGVGRTRDGKAISSSRDGGEDARGHNAGGAADCFGVGLEREERGRYRAWGFSKGNRVLRSACGGNDCSPDKLDGSFANPICASLVVTGGDEMALIWSRRPAAN